MYIDGIENHTYNVRMGMTSFHGEAHWMEEGRVKVIVPFLWHLDCGSIEDSGGPS